jgi:hypothetical protein
MRANRLTAAVAVALGLALTSACAATPPQTQAAGSAPATSASDPPPSAIGSATASPNAGPTLPVSATSVPTPKSDLPDGNYRTVITQQLLDEHNVYDRGQIGTWTLVVRNGGYQLWCATEESADTCGDDRHAGNVQVEQGFLRGPGPTVWFVHDMPWTLHACGATNGHPDCPSGGYRMTWRSTKDGLVFSDWFGLGDEGTGAYATDASNWTIQPWTRVG